MVGLPFLSHVHTKPDIFETAFFFIRIRVDRLVKAVYGQVARSYVVRFFWSSRPKYSFMWLQILSLLTTS